MTAARLASRLSCLVAAALFVALPARAGLFDDEEARARVEKLRNELRGEIDSPAKRVDVVAQNQMDFANQAESLKNDVAKLRGQIEVLVYELESTQKRQKDFYIDLDSRLRKLETAAAETAKAEAAAPAKTEAPTSDPAAEMRDYENALTAFKGAKYKDAHAAFVGFVKNYPSSTLQASAHYWAASSLYQLKDYGRAAELFGALVANWPNDNKAPDAMLAEANAQIEGGDVKSGRKTLEALAEKYPTSNAAQTARQRLKALAPPPPAPRKKK